VDIGDIKMQFNQVNLAGYLTKDPQARSVGAKNTTLCTFSLAVQIDKKKDTMFIDCIAWGKAGETIVKYLNKGSNMFVSGELETSSWTDKETQQKRSKMQLNVRNFQFLNDRQEAKPQQDRAEGSSVAVDEDF